jgi:hypothetical protein
MLSGVDSTTVAATFSNGVYIPEYVYIVFQMTFACITPGLILGAVAERMKFSAVLLFMALWVTLIYFPIAHMVWYWGGPDAFGNAAKALAEAAADKKAEAQAALDAVTGDAGLLFKWGALDFAGGNGRPHQRRYCRSGRRPHPRQARRLRQGTHAAPLAHHVHDRRSPSVGRLVRLQRRLQPRDQRLRRPGDDQHLHRDRRRRSVVDDRRMDRQG